MTPLREPPRQFLVTFTEAEADAGRRFIADAMRPPVATALVEYQDHAAIVLAKLQIRFRGLVESRCRRDRDVTVGDQSLELGTGLVAFFLTFRHVQSDPTFPYVL